MKLPLSLSLAVLGLQLVARAADACTVIAVGRNATTDGSTLVAHTDDAGGGAGDVRLIRVPAQTHAPDAQRAVYNINGGFPRLVTHDRGPMYAPHDASQVVMTPMGFIPQVPHTYAYWDQDYGMMNEVQLSIGESTCGAKTAGWPLDAGVHGKNLFGIAELTKVALERCDSARCAVQTMGDLAVKYGFYSEDSGDVSAPDYGDSAEALGIADKYGEVWIFHIMTGPDNAGAVWAAQRVPDDHVTALANGFSIREMDLSKPDWFLASPNVHSFAETKGWWDPKAGAFDFTAAYGYADKDAIGPLYTGRRLWRIFDVVAPSLKLDARLGSFSQYATYPFSVKPDTLVDINTVMELLRDHYEGTKYDMTKGIAAGPFGAPVRFGGNSQGVLGGWERPISMHRTLYSFVLQSRGALPDAVGCVVWYAQDAPHGSVYVPFSCRQENVPTSYTTGKQSSFSTSSAWWAFNFVNNWSLLRFNAINQEVRDHIHALQSAAFMQRQSTERRALEMLPGGQNPVQTGAVDQFIQAQSNAFANEVVDHWWSLAWTLVAKYSNGYVTTGEGATDMQSPGYPAWWLQVSEFSKWPGDSFTPRDSVKKMLKGLPTPAINAAAHASSGGASLAAIIGWVLFGFVTGAGTFGLVQLYRRRGYSSVL